MGGCWLLLCRLKEERQRAREERIRHTNEQIARIKQRQRETEQKQEQWNQLQPYILTAASVAVALIGYFIYQYFTWCELRMLHPVDVSLPGCYSSPLAWTFCRPKNCWQQQKQTDREDDRRTLNTNGSRGWSQIGGEDGQMLKMGRWRRRWRRWHYFLHLSVFTIIFSVFSG